jgi:Sec-independent protein translocase protein TatA
LIGISFEQLVILLLLAFILFGPEKLPEYAAKLGRLVAKLRQASAEVTKEYQNPFQYPPPQPQIAPEHPCPKCFQPVGPEFTFCPHCGQRIKEPPAPPQPLAS